MDYNHHDLPTTLKTVSAHESSNLMDHVSHPLRGKSQTTHYQPHLHRRSRPSTLRLEGRLSRRILRRRSPHRFPSNLRGCLCPLGRSGRNLETKISSAHKCDHSPTLTWDGSQGSAASSRSTHPQVHIRHPFSLEPALSNLSSPASLALPCVPLCPLCLVVLKFSGKPHHASAVCPSKARINPKPTLLQPLLHNCECPMNRSCGKQIHQPRTKPVIVEDTTCCVSLLTGTISGSNFAIP